MQATLEDFLKLDIRLGTIVSARPNEGARKPAYVMEVDFGPEIGRKLSSGQLTEAYTAEELVGLQVIGVVNFPPVRIAGVKSEVLVMGVVQEDGPTILLTPTQKAANGSRLA